MRFHFYAKYRHYMGFPDLKLIFWNFDKNIYCVITGSRNGHPQMFKMVCLAVVINALNNFYSPSATSCMQKSSHVLVAKAKSCSLETDPLI